MNRSLVVVALFLSTLSLPLSAADEPPGVYVILDGSGSMWGQLADGTHKITAARDVVQRFRAEDYAGRELAFRVYGHRREADCSDTDLVVPFSSPNEALLRMASFADQVNPKGKTPIARSLRAALEDFGDRPGEIILISDGIETCDDDPCALVREWRDKQVDIRVHVVGLGLQDKERVAMECISEAAGTTYRDAQSADEIVAGLEEIRQGSEIPPGEPEESLDSDWRALDIAAANEAGEPMRVEGTARWEGGDPVAVSSNGHNLVPPGDVEVTVGVRTWNGNLYRPVTTRVAVAPSGETDLLVVVAEPPSVRAKFLEAGEEHRGSFVTAFADSEEVFGFRSQDRAYVDPGTYEFRASPNDDNELSITATLADGDHETLVFELVRTVRATIRMISAGSHQDFRTNYELWQDGEKKYGVHWSNGVQALPGAYDLVLPLRLTPYTHQGLVLTNEDGQEHVIEVPVGHVTVRYQKADGSPERAARVFVERKNEEGRWVGDGIKQAGQPLPLLPGEYRVKGWSALGNHDIVLFEVAVGEEKEIALRDRGE